MDAARVWIMMCMDIEDGHERRAARVREYYVFRHTRVAFFASRSDKKSMEET